VHDAASRQTLTSMYDELRSLRDKHGIFLRREAIALGYTDVHLARAVRHGSIVRLRHGTYMFKDEWEPLSHNERHAVVAMAVLRTAKTKLVFSHGTAVVLHEAPTWELPLDNVQVTRTDRKGGRTEAGLAQHRGLLLPPDIENKDGYRLTTPTRTALDVTTIVDVEHSLPVLDFFLHAGLTTKRDLRKGAEAMRFWRDTLGTDLAVRLANPRCESVGESRTSYMLWLYGVPAPKTGHEVFDSSGHLIARLDFAWPELGVFLEFDGKEKYAKYLRPGETVVDAVLREKKREERICRLTGWRCIRITWANLFRPEQTTAYIKSVLAGGPVHV
jgi:hypothetical protein